MSAGAAVLDEQTLVEYESDVVETLAMMIDCSYGDASGIVSLHLDIIEAGYEERAHPSVIARELDAQSIAGGVPIQVERPQACSARTLQPELVEVELPRLVPRRTRPSDETRAQAQARARARKRIMEVLVDVTSKRVQMQTAVRLRVVGATSSSARLARAQGRAAAYAEILEPIVTAWGEGANDEDVAAAVAAACETLIGEHLGAPA